MVEIKETIERQTESLIKKVLDKEESDTREGAMSPTGTTQLEFGDRTVKEVMVAFNSEMKELSDIINELTALIVQMLSEKKQVKAQLVKELDLREQIEKAIEKQDIDRMTTDMLIMKIKLLQSQLDNIDSVFKEKESIKQSSYGREILTQLK